MIEKLTLEIAEVYAPVYPEGATWEQTARFLLENEPERMNELRESIRKYGFREPIVLSTAEDLTDESQPRVLNGTHRLVIALLEGMVTIPTELMSEVNARYDENEAQLQVSITNIGEDLTNEEDDIIVERLGSWPLNEKNWITSSVAFGGVNNWEFVLDNGDLRDARLIRERVLEILKHALPQRNFAVVVSTYKG